MWDTILSYIGIGGLTAIMGLWLGQHNRNTDKKETDVKNDAESHLLLKQVNSDVADIKSGVKQIQEDSKNLDKRVTILEYRVDNEHTKS